jgi:hypothetical protein
MVVDAARWLAEDLLADALPGRWSHVAGVADTACRLAGLLEPDSAEVVTAAAWLHDIGYARDLVITGFHPIDGAAYLARGGMPFPSTVIGLVAHHSGAAFEAAERGVENLLNLYPAPDAVELAILSCADLCTGPDGGPVDPADRIAEVLTRYPPDNPVHRAIARSAPLLLAQARLVLAAAEAMRGRWRRVALPDCVERRGTAAPVMRAAAARRRPLELVADPAGPQWEAVWSREYHRLAATSTGADVDASCGVKIILTGPPDRWDPADADAFAEDLRAAAAAAAGEELCWAQYRAVASDIDTGLTDGGTDRPTMGPPGESACPTRLSTTFYFDDILRFQVDMAFEGRSVHVQQRIVRTLNDVTDWTDLTHLMVEGATEHQFCGTGEQTGPAVRDGDGGVGEP